MFCESYRESLSNAAIAGVALTRGQEVHLQNCPSCRMAFAEERALLASIDSGLSALVNPEVPASLLPAVRAKIEAAPAQASTWRIPIFALASTAAALATGFFLYHAQPKASVPAAATLTVQVDPPSTAPDLKTESSAKSSASASPKANRTQPAAAPAAPTFESQVLVAREEQVNFQKYLASLHSRGVTTGGEVMAKSETSEKIATLEIAQLEFGRLNIEPLSSGDSQ